MGESTGALFTSVTTMVNCCVALMLGTPLSKARTTMLLVDGPWASLGVQVNTPLLPLREAPEGAAPTNSKVTVLGGESVSVAMFVRVMLVNSAMLRVVLLRLVIMGAALTSLTMMVNCCVALMLGTPLSATLTVTRILVGPCNSVGVKVSRPVWVLTAMPVLAGETKEMVRVFVGMSEAVATSWTVSVLAS